MTGGITEGERENIFERLKKIEDWIDVQESIKAIEAISKNKEEGDR